MEFPCLREYKKIAHSFLYQIFSPLSAHKSHILNRTINKLYLLKISTEDEFEKK